MNTEIQEQKGHPRGLYLLFTTEMWERFSYYGMRAILMLFMTKALLFDSGLASGIYGNFTGLVYLTPLIGGYISDRYWGNRRSILVGGIVMAIGQFLLFGSASMLGNSTLSTSFFIAGLTTLIIGNGFFKPNISTMVNQLYPQGDKRVDSAFSIFYMGINLGAFFSPLICGSLAEKIDFRWGFFAAGVGMVISIITFELLKNKLLVSAEGEAIGGKPKKGEVTKEVAEALDTNGDGKVTKSDFSAGRILLWLGIYAVLWVLFLWVIEFPVLSTFIFATSIASAGFVITDPKLTKIDRDRITVIYIIAFFVIFFWSAFEQAGASLTLFADQQTDRSIFGWEMPASWFQSANPLFIIIFAPLFAVVWIFLGKRNMEPPSPVKQSIGLFLLAVGYLIIAFGVKGMEPGAKTSMLWLASMYLVHTFGELCLSPIGLSMVARLAPLRLASLLMGIWFMSNAMANDFAGMLSKFYPEKMVNVEQVASFETSYNIKLVDRTKENKLENVEEINSVASLPISKVKFDDIKDAGVKATVYQELAKNSLVKEKSIFGLSINSLFSFFMIFVVMAGVAAVVLYFLSGTLLKMMHGIR